MFFLLTDGQDHNNFKEKLALAKRIKDAGTSLFVFGFGADHDSAHMTSIADAAEGQFIYVESNDTVVDAFGGAIGSQLGMKLRNITLRVNATQPNLTIKRCLSGTYRSVISSDRQSVTVSFVNLFPGEKRDVLLELFVPATSKPCEYPLITSSATFFLEGNESEVTSSEDTCVITRVNDKEVDTTVARNIEIDTQIVRNNATTSLQQALGAADSGDFEGAKARLTAAIAELSTSASCRAQVPLSINLLQDLEEGLSNVSSRSAYHGGGRALMTETYSCQSKSRQVYSKKGKSSPFQSPSSLHFQSCGTAYSASKSSHLQASPNPKRGGSVSSTSPSTPSPSGTTSQEAKDSSSSIFSIFSWGKKSDK